MADTNSDTALRPDAPVLGRDQDAVLTLSGPAIAFAGRTTEDPRIAAAWAVSHLAQGGDGMVSVRPQGGDAKIENALATAMNEAMLLSGDDDLRSRLITPASPTWSHVGERSFESVPETALPGLGPVLHPGPTNPFVLGQGNADARTSVAPKIEDLTVEAFLAAMNRDRTNKNGIPPVFAPEQATQPPPIEQQRPGL